MTDFTFRRPNVSLSATSNSVSPTVESPSPVAYIPPHQKERLNLIGNEITRLGFDVRSFASQYSLQIAHEDGRSDAGGIFMWRGVWDSSVSDIYKNILSQSPMFFPPFFWLNFTLECPEPRFGRPPKFDPYINEDGQRTKKYVETPPHIGVSPIRQPRAMDTSLRL